jgi:predicted esterase
MGAWAAHHTILALQKTSPYLPPPTLFVPACFPAPDLALGASRPWTPCRGLSEAAFQAECRGWAINEAVLNTPHLWASFGPMIRADFTLFDECPPDQAAGGKLPCPVAVCWAREDSRVPEKLALGWQRFAANGHFHVLPPALGHHLFLLDDDLKAAWVTQALIPALTLRAFVAPDMTPPPPPPPPHWSAAADASAAMEGLALEAPPTEALPTEVPPALAEAAAKVQAAWPLRILCLHGFGGSGTILSKQTERLRLLVDADLAAAVPGASVEWSFLTAPDAVSWDPEGLEAKLVTTFFPDGPHRQWMRRVAASNGSATSAQEYADWGEPLAFVLDHLEQQAAPYHGLLGFSQGSNLATLLAAALESGTVPIRHAPLAFVVPVCGSAFGWQQQWASASAVRPCWPKDTRLFEKPLKTPSLHFIGSADPQKPASEALVQLYGVEAEVVLFASGHKPPTQKAAAGALAAFLLKAVQGIAPK